MDMDPGKVFVGGIAWDTSEERLREYFQTFGEVIEAVIMKDRTTGRARGFGFVVFANGSVADKVVRERHVIDGRTVEAKKAVPRDDNQNFVRNNGSIHGSPGPIRTKKIFVGGLASTVTETDFKMYFDQFGTITDVVVMYDQNTQRPRGFGFITYDSENAVDRVLVKTFHELNGKMVEVKRAVPKELSPQGQARGYNNGLNRVSNSPISNTPGYNLNSGGGRGMRANGQLSPVTVNRSGYYPYSPNSLIGMNMHSGFGSNNGSSGVSLLGHGNTYHNGNSNRYESAVGYDMDYSGNNLSSNIANRNMWANANLINSTNSKIELGSGNAGVIGRFGRIVQKQGSSPELSGSSFIRGNNKFGSEENYFGAMAGNVRSSGGIVGTLSSHTTINNIHEGGFRSPFGGDSFYWENAWRSSSPVLDNSASFRHGLGDGPVTRPNGSIGYSGPGGYPVAARSNNGGVAA